MGGNHERDAEMTEWEKEEKASSFEGSRANTRVDHAHGSAPVLISITLMAQTYIGSGESNQDYDSVLKTWVSWLQMQNH